MAVYKNISSKSVIRKIMRDLGLSTDNWIDDSIEGMGEALEHIGASAQLEKKVCAIPVLNYTASLPSDLYYINLVAINESVPAARASELQEITAQIAAIKDILDADPTQEVNTELNKLNSRLVILENMYWTADINTLSPLAYATADFPNALHVEGCKNKDMESKNTYFINGGKVKTSFPSGTVCISYMAFPLDEDCYPMIPDDISFREAMFWYVYKKLLLRDPNTKPNGITYEIAEGQWKYYCTQARNAANYPDISKMESFMNQWVRLIPNMSRQDDGFDNLNTREELNRG
jgi:hypothetical protein